MDSRRIEYSIFAMVCLVRAKLDEGVERCDVVGICVGLGTIMGCSKRTSLSGGRVGEERGGEAVIGVREGRGGGLGVRQRFYRRVSRSI